jgi:hypothetical protein
MLGYLSLTGGRADVRRLDGVKQHGRSDTYDNAPRHEAADPLLVKFPG